jgi:glucose-1-phosphate adenylyltransferase
MYNDKVLNIILGGGQGSRLFPLTEKRSKPAVSIAGKYRLVDIPISNCINCNLKRMYVLTQFNSASLNNIFPFRANFSLGRSSSAQVFIDKLPSYAICAKINKKM